MFGWIWSKLAADLEQRRALAKLSRAKQLQAEAQRMLAASSEPTTTAPILFDRASAWIPELLRRETPRLTRIAGVLGTGLGRRWRQGVETDELCAQVFVEHKLDPREMAARGIPAVPSVLGQEQALPVDVIELGAFQRLLAIGDSLGIERERTKGTLGAIAVDRWSREPVALTAMHVVEHGVAEQAQVYTPSLRDQGQPVAIGEVMGGTMRGTDIAKIRLRQPALAHAAIPGLGPIRGWRPVSYPGDVNTTVQMCGASSSKRHGRIVTPALTLFREELDAAILVDIPTREGDSGAAIVDSERMLLGFLVGRYQSPHAPHGALAVFTPAQRALAAVACDIPTQLPGPRPAPATRTARPAPATRPTRKTRQTSKTRTRTR